MFPSKRKKADSDSEYDLFSEPVSSHGDTRRRDEKEASEVCLFLKLPLSPKRDTNVFSSVPHPRQPCSIVTGTANPEVCPIVPFAFNSAKDI